MGNLINDEEIERGEGILHHEEGIDLMPENIELSGLEVSLAHSIAEQKDDLPLLWETIRTAEEEIDALPDGMAGLSQMHEYGYSWDEMLPLTKDRALELFGEDVPVYQLHADGSETLVEDRAALEIGRASCRERVSLQV